MSTPWRSGNRARLLENGEEYFPAVFKAIRSARHEVIVETFIVFEDKVGLELHAALIEAARRGARVDVLVDGFGSSDLTPAFKASLAEAGVRLRSFDPAARILGIRTNVLRRMHRKLIVVDGVVAFAGGINFSADHLNDYGPEAKQDYAVELEGPIVQDIHHHVTAAIRPSPDRDGPAPVPVPSPPAGPAEALLVVRDNDRHRDDIERHYRAAIRSARSQVIIANAYFFPGWRLLRDMVRAARRGVSVQLILQGQPDMLYVRTAARLLYPSLVKDGVQIYEYCRRPLHAKVAVVDGQWCTVGSSNLDPLSLSLNLEANVVVNDRGFAGELRQRLQQLEREHCRLIRLDHLPRRTGWRYVLSALGYHVARRFPSWLQRLPGSVPRIRSFDPERGVETVALHEPGEPEPR